VITVSDEELEAIKERAQTFRRPVANLGRLLLLGDAVVTTAAAESQPQEVASA
jgi:hypothetical protein